MIDWKQLAVALIRYDMDSPHLDELYGFYPDLTWDEVQKWLDDIHCGDCVGMPASCPRCIAEYHVHRAKWVAENILPFCEPIREEEEASQ